MYLYNVESRISYKRNDKLSKPSITTCGGRGYKDHYCFAKIKLNRCQIELEFAFYEVFFKPGFLFQLNLFLMSANLM